MYEVHNLDERPPAQFQFLIDNVNEKRTIHLVQEYFSSNMIILLRVTRTLLITLASDLDVYCVVPLVRMYHRSSTTEIKNDIIADMKRPDGELRLVLATSSLSIGIDMAGIKYVIHHGVPMTSDDFLQKTGRAGREADSKCHFILVNYGRG